MSSVPARSRTALRSGTSVPVQTALRLPVTTLGMSLGVFLAVTFVLCVGFDLLFPGLAMYESWLQLLPGFTWLSWPELLPRAG